MRKYLAPIGLILCLCLGLATAQNITKSMQMSQDASGPFSVDSNNGIYFPSHLNTVGKPLPTITGTGTPTIDGTDTAGLITMGTSATTATAVFGRAYVTVPYCVVTWGAPQNGTATPIAYVLTTTSIALSQGSTSGNKINYICMSAS